VALGAQLPVRLDADIEDRLESIAQRTGTTKSGLIRMLAKRFVETCVNEDGSVTFPPDIRAMLNDRDDRSVPKPAPAAEPVSYKKDPSRKVAERSRQAAKLAAAMVRGARASQP